MSAPKLNDKYYSELSNKYANRLDQELRRLDSECASTVSTCQSNMKRNPDFSGYGSTGFSIGLIAGIFTCGGNPGFESFLFGGLIGFGLVFLVYLLVCAARSSERSRLEGEIRAAERERDSLKAETKKANSEALAAEYSKHLDRVSKMGTEFYNSWKKSGTNPRIIHWLGGLSREVILNATHYRWCEKITPSITLTVNKRTVTAALSVTEYVELDDNDRPKQKQPEIWKTDTFTFEHERMSSPVTSSDEYTSYCERCAYARFLARVCKEGILQAYPRDPNASVNVPKEDATVELKYGGESASVFYYATNTELAP